MAADPPEPQGLRAEYVKALRRCTPKQRRWLREVAVQAGQRWAACYKLGYSTRTCTKWLRQPKIQHLLDLQARMAEEDNDLTPARIQREYGRLAFSSLQGFYREDGSLKSPHEWTEDQAAAVQEYYFDASGKPRIKLFAKPLDAVAKIRGVLVDRRELSGPGGGPIPIRNQHVDELTDEQLEDIARRGRTAPAEPPEGEG